MNWKEELTKILEDGCTDSDIEDFVYNHPDTSDAKIWNFVNDYNAPPKCKGCKYNSNLPWYHPCVDCLRVGRVDYYKERD